MSGQNCGMNCQCDTLTKLVERQKQLIIEKYGEIKALEIKNETMKEGFGAKIKELELAIEHFKGCSVENCPSVEAYIKSMIGTDKTK